MIARIVFALAVIFGAVQVLSAQTVTYVHTDGLGSPVLETDSAGAVVRQIDFRAYGEEVLSPAQNGVAFTGHYRDANAGLVYMQQRYFDPGVGRFMSVDPVRTEGEFGRNINRYDYAANSPFKYVDPDGRSPSKDGQGGANLGLILAVSHGLIRPEDAMIVARGEEASGNSQFAETLRLHAERTRQQIDLSLAMASASQTMKILNGEGDPIAGAGTSVVLRAAPGLAEKYGGDPGDWAKVNGGDFKARDGRKVETHAYRNVRNGLVVEIKSKIADEVPRSKNSETREAPTGSHIKK